MSDKKILRPTHAAGPAADRPAAGADSGLLPDGHQLRLLALDESDLDVISAHLQDGLVRRADLHYFPGERRFVLAVQRFEWERTGKGPPRRRLTALHFEQVRAVRHRNLGKAPDALHNLLAVCFIERDKPSGAILLEFAGGAAILLDVECIEAQLRDLGPVWEVDARPPRGRESRDELEGENADKA